jgi:ornithine cyclodeaminase/alanine dehydrogenase-like protein (mu-crystallin family)
LNVLSATAIEALAQAHWEGLIGAASDALSALALGQYEAPQRTSLALDNGTLLTMPGRISNAQFAVVKLVTVVPDNGQSALPAVQGAALVFDSATGSIAALLDGAALTAVRTPAVTLAAIRRLGHSPRRVAILGAGVQALWHARALASTYPLDSISLWSRNPVRSHTLAAQLSVELGMHVRTTHTPDAALHAVDLVVCCTASREPLIEMHSLPSTPLLVAAIGAFTPDMAEIGPSLFERAQTVYVDDVAAVLQEGGDVLQAIDAGALSPSAVVPVGGGIKHDGTLTLFKSVGSAVEDAAVAEYLWRVASPMVIPDVDPR